MEYVEAIKEDINGSVPVENEYYASDYFQQLWDFAVQSDKGRKEAYIDEQNSEQIAAQKGITTRNQA